MAGQEVKDDISSFDLFYMLFTDWPVYPPEELKGVFKKQPLRSKMAFVACISIASMSALIMDMFLRPNVASVLTHHDLLLIAILMGMTLLSVVCRLDTVLLDCPDSDTKSLFKLYFLGVPMVVLDSLLLAKFAGVMFVGHVITMKLMVVFVLSAIPLALLAPVCMMEACPGLTSILISLVLNLVMKAALTVVLAIGAAVLAIVASIVFAIASPLLVPLLAIYIIFFIITAAIEGLAYMSHCASYQLGCRGQVPAPGSDDFFPITRRMLEPCSETQAARQGNAANDEPSHQSGPTP